ncbi:MAG: hypothetical protein M5R36_16555 [Deltaproteobacteria bacterium]|nr:hypothetical protein [Deltaproteobacteria bacterium]
MWLHATVKCSSHQETEIAGLCATCRHTVMCMHWRAHQGPVMRCEEFEVETLVEPAVALASNAADMDAEDGETYRGLCATCALRKSCTLSDPRAGVWTCEEYV